VISPVGGVNPNEEPIPILPFSLDLADTPFTSTRTGYLRAFGRIVEVSEVWVSFLIKGREVFWNIVHPVKEQLEPLVAIPVGDLGLFQIET
jgi:hypothetical protein